MPAQRLEITGRKFEPIINELAKRLHGEYSTDCDVIDFTFDNQNGQGRVFATSFFDWLTFLLFKIELSEDLEITIASEKNLRCFFCQEGNIRYADGASNYEVTALTGLISANKKNEPHVLKLSKNTPTTFSYLEFDKTKYFHSKYCSPDNLHQDLEQTLRDTEGERSFFYQGSLGLNTTEVLQQIILNQYAGWLKRFFFNAKSLEMLTLQLQDYTNVKKNLNSYSLSEYEVEQIKKAKNLIVTNVAYNYSITELAREVGLNQQKLKQGFKLLYGKTIKNFTLHERMERAKMMLLDREKKIIDISSALGYSNRTHFSRIFKRRYGVLPSDFVKSLDLLNIY